MASRHTGDPWSRRLVTLARASLGLCGASLHRLATGLSRDGGDTRRCLLIVLGIAALGASQSEGHRFGEHWGLLAGLMTALLLAFALVLCAAALAPPLEWRLFRRAPRTIVAAAAVCILVLAGHSSGQIRRVTDRLSHRAPFSNDAVTMSSCATDLLINGHSPPARDLLQGLHEHNPYEAVNIIRCLWTHGYYLNGDLTTPLQQGAFSNVSIYPARKSLDRALRQAGLHNVERPLEFESQVSYPAGSFLVPALAWLLGIRDLRLLFVLCFLAAYAFILLRAPRRLWLWVLLIAYANMVVWANAASGASDALYVLLVLAGWSLRRHGVPSAVAMGLAATVRQQSWFFLLFYAILIVREEGWPELWRRGRIVGAIFVLTNLPFFLLSPQAWISGILSPVSDPMFALGSGIIAPVLGATDWSAKLIPLPPRWVFALLEAGTLALCITIYAQVCRRWPHLGLILAVVPLFFAWRSLFSYFYPVSILALGAVVELSRTPAVVEHEGTAPRRPRARPMAVRVAPPNPFHLSA